MLAQWQTHFPDMVDATCPQVVMNGEQLDDIQPEIIPDELSEQFAPSVATISKMIRSQCLRARLRKATKGLSDFDQRELALLNEEGNEEDAFFSISVNREDSFQAAISFMPED